MCKLCLHALLIGLITMHGHLLALARSSPGRYTVFWNVKGFQQNYQTILIIVYDSYLIHVADLLWFKLYIVLIA